MHLHIVRSGETHCAFGMKKPCKLETTHKFVEDEYREGFIY